MRPLVLLLLLLVLLAACARPQPASMPPAPPALAWAAGPALPAPRDHHVTFAVEAGGVRTLVVAGGMRGGMPTGSYTDEVWGSAIATDGSLAAWRALAPLPEPRAGASVVVAGRSVVVTSGNTTGHRPATATLVARVDAGGTLGAWAAGPALPAARFHHASVHHRGTVYVLGGLERGRATRTVFRARLAPDGTLGAWEAPDSLPAPRSHHAAFVHGDAIYLAGGIAATPRDADQLRRDVIRAPVLADGRLGAWDTVSVMDSSYVTAAAAVHGGAVYLVGGVENGRRFTDGVQVARLGRDGRPGAWTTAAGRLPAGRAHVHQVPVVGGRLYSVAGLGAAPFAEVYVSGPLPR